MIFLLCYYPSAYLKSDCALSCAPNDFVRPEELDINEVLIRHPEA